MAEIEMRHINNRDYVSLEDAGRYLGCSTQQAMDYVYLGDLRAELIETRWMVDWQSVTEFAHKRGQRRRAG